MGYYTLPVPYGHADFCKLQTCDCGGYQRQLAGRAAQLGDELGDLHDKTFGSFDGDRPLAPIVWSGHAFGVQAQRTALHQALSRARAYADSPRGWLYLHGAFGAGKSHLAAAIAHDVQASGSIVRFHTAGRLLDALTSAIRDGTTDRLLADLLTCDLLILDELAAAHLSEAASDWRFGRIERLLNERIGRALVITSNVAPDDLAAVGDIRAERLADRIAGESRLIWLPIASYRRIDKEAS